MEAWSCSDINSSIRCSTAAGVLVPRRRLEDDRSPVSCGARVPLDVDANLALFGNCHRDVLAGLKIAAAFALLHGC